MERTYRMCERWSDMNLFDWFGKGLTVRRQSLWLYRRGMKHVKQERHAEAIKDYTEVIELPRVPADIRAMAYYNRALVHSAVSDESAAVADLQKVLKLAGATEQVLTEARRRLFRITKPSSKS